MDLNNVTWGEFKVEDLFDIHPTSSYKLTNKEIYDVQGDTPVLSNSSINNGIGGYCGLAPTEDEGIITFSDTTTGTDTMFYQPNKFIGYPHVQGMYPKGTHKWSDKECLYLISIIKRSAGKGWNYSNKFNRKIVLGLHVKLPITSDGAIDWQFMEDYITELEQERITELEQYLIATGLNDYHLTVEEKILLDQDVKFKMYKIKDLFEVQTPIKRFNANSVIVTEDKGYPYVVRSSNNNGIRGYIEEDEQYLNEGKTFSFGQDTATVFWQEKPYFTGDKIKILKPKFNCNEEIAMYLINSISKYFSNYRWGSQSFKMEVIENAEIYLPTTDGNIPDWQYMENYIKAIEKLVIKDVVDWKDSVIEKTKEVIN